MIVTIQQPEHIPWLGFFDKMRKCQKYIFLDNVQFKKRYFENRNKIRTKDGWQWLTVPVLSKSRFHQNINEVEIDNSGNWQKKYLGSIQAAYSKAPFFDDLFPQIEDVISCGHTRLVELNLALIEISKKKFGIKTDCCLASKLVPNGLYGSDLILRLCQEVLAKTYISGPDGDNYLQLDNFKNAGVEVIYHNFSHPTYHQIHSSDFVSHLSNIDYLFNNGE